MSISELTVHCPLFFLGHYAKINSMEEVKAVIAKLYENRKIANATHNMYAYRISQSKGTFISYIIILEIYS